MIGALGVEQIKAGLFGEWSVDDTLFLGFIEQCLAPALKPGEIVVMDNLRVDKVKEAIELVGARLVYLPPYSLDSSPIECCWSKIKSYLRKKAVRNNEQLHSAICDAFKTVITHDIEGWFELCGYSIQ
jgi:transposase